MTTPPWGDKVHKKGVAPNIGARLQAVKEQHLAGKVAEAEQGYRTLLTQYPGLKEALHPLGIALQQQGKHAEAVTFIARWLAQAPADYEAHINHANSLLALERGTEAEAAISKAMALRPGAGELHLLKALAQQIAGDPSAAERSVRQMLAQQPGSPEALFTLGNILCAQGRDDEGIDAYRMAIRNRPHMVEPMVNLASRLQARGLTEEAIAIYKQALTVQPGMPEALLNLTTIEYENGGDAEQARRNFEQVLAKLPDHGDTLNNLANIHMNLNQLDKAERYIRRRLAQSPPSSSAHGTAAALFMLKGQWEEGWQHFEWRWLRDNLPVPLRDFGKPEWQGEDISDKTILIHHEQGLGDSIQFVRFVAQVVPRAAHVILEVPGSLMALYSTIPGVTLAAYDGPLPAFDVHLAVMSLPYVLGLTVDTLPAAVPYLQADPARVAAWRDRLPPGGFRIGIVWQGKPGTGVDKGRSYTLDRLAPIARVPGVTLISLQKGHGLDQLDRLPDGMKVETLGPDFDEGPGAFLDTAAVMQHMDLIISSDTSVAHLAGALGRPVWVPLKFSPDWRWMVDRQDSPWYPGTMRLFRQQSPGDWDGVFQRLAADVAALVGGDRSKLSPPPPPPRVPPVPFPPVPRPPLPSHRPHVMLAAQPAAERQRELTRTYFIASRDVGAGIKETDIRYGRIRYPANDVLIGTCLDFYGEWGADEIEVYSQLLEKGDVVIDAGANVGSIAVALASLVGPTGQVHAFEPQPLIHELLCWNIQANGYNQVRTYHAALGSETGSISLPPTDYDHLANFGGVSLVGATSGVDVPLVTIDSLGLERLDLLKADVEGMEQQVVLGARETIMRCRPALYVECSAEQEDKEQTRQLIDLIKGMNYRLWWHQSLLYRDDNYRGIKLNLFADVASSNLVCLPVERRPVVMGLPPVDVPGPK